jgi:hypothetical protein
VAESDSDTTLGLEQHREQIPLCRQRTSPKSSKRKMSDSPSRQPNYNDDSPSTKWIPPSVARERRYKYFFYSFLRERTEREKKKITIVGVTGNSFHMQ